MTPLSPREKQLLRCIALGWDASKCAEEMRVTKSCIAAHKHNLRKQLPPEAQSHDGLYAWAKENIKT
jgi:DNA-binding NarL/FixJ family response regulator